MASLLKSDLYRLAHGRALWIAAAVLALAAWLMPWIFQSVSSLYSFGTYDLGFSLTTSQSISQITSTSTHLFGSTLLSTGLLNLISCIFAAVVLSTDFETGYIRNLWSVRRARRPYMAEKLILCVIISACFILVGTMFCLGGAYAAGLYPQLVEEPDDIAMWIALVWLSATAYLFITATVIMLTRSQSAGLVTAILLSTGILENLIFSIYGVIFMPSPTASNAPVWLLAYNFMQLAEGSAGIAPNAIHIEVVAGIMIAASIVVTMAFAARKDA